MAADTAIAMLLTVRSITQVLRRVLASCTTCLFMEIFQRTLSYGAHRSFLSESGCKGTAFSDTLQIFRQLFSKKREDFRVCLQNECLHLIYNIIGVGILHVFSE